MDPTAIRGLMDAGTAYMLGKRQALEDNRKRALELYRQKMAEQKDTLELEAGVAELANRKRQYDWEAQDRAYAESQRGKMTVAIWDKLGGAQKDAYMAAGGQPPPEIAALANQAIPGRREALTDFTLNLPEAKPLTPADLMPGQGTEGMPPGGVMRPGGQFEDMRTRTVETPAKFSFEKAEKKALTAADVMKLAGPLVTQYPWQRIVPYLEEATGVDLPDVSEWERPAFETREKGLETRARERLAGRIAQDIFGAITTGNVPVSEAAKLGKIVWNTYKMQDVIPADAPEPDFEAMAKNISPDKMLAAIQRGIGLALRAYGLDFGVAQYIAASENPEAEYPVATEVLPMAIGGLPPTLPASPGINIPAGANPFGVPGSRLGAPAPARAGVSRATLPPPKPKPEKPRPLSDADNSLAGKLGIFSWIRERQPASVQRFLGNLKNFKSIELDDGSIRYTRELTETGIANRDRLNGKPPKPLVRTNTRKFIIGKIGQDKYNQLYTDVAKGKRRKTPRAEMGKTMREGFVGKGMSKAEAQMASDYMLRNAN